jgi:hypothetical protein
MSDVEAEQKREEDERLDTAEDPNEEVLHLAYPIHAQGCPQSKAPIYCDSFRAKLTTARLCTSQDMVAN